MAGVEVVITIRNLTPAGEVRVLRPDEDSVLRTSGGQAVRPPDKEIDVEELAWKLAGIMRRRAIETGQ